MSKVVDSFARLGELMPVLDAPVMDQQAVDQAYHAYLNDELEARSAADMFTQMRSQKAGYWEARRQDLLDMVDSIGRAQ